MAGFKSCYSAILPVGQGHHHGADLSPCQTTWLRAGVRSHLIKTLVFLHVGFLICEMGQPGFLLPGGALCQLCVQLDVVKPHFLWDPEVKGTGRAPGMMYSSCVLTVSTSTLKHSSRAIFSCPFSVLNFLRSFYKRSGQFSCTCLGFPLD